MAELYAAGSDPEIWKVHPVPDRYTESGFRKFFDGALNSKMGFVFVDRASGRLIGSSRYYGYEPERGEIEIGWTFIVRSHWGGAANREVKRLMLDHAFAFVDTVVFWVGEENWRSQGAMTKIGGVRREELFTRELSGDGRISSSTSRRTAIGRVGGRCWLERPMRLRPHGPPERSRSGAGHDLFVVVRLFRLGEIQRYTLQTCTRRL